MKASPDCPCGSGAKYRLCCGPIHRCEQPPALPEQLMRARFCAFAMKELGFLWRTLHPSHPDRSRPEAEVARELRATAASLRFVRLKILEAPPPAAAVAAQVLFLAEVFERGKDRSFVELSDFERDSDKWTYVRGTARTLADLAGGSEGLTVASFLEEGADPVTP